MIFAEMPDLAPWGNISAMTLLAMVILWLGPRLMKTVADEMRKDREAFEHRQRKVVDAIQAQTDHLTVRLDRLNEALRYVCRANGRDPWKGGP